MAKLFRSEPANKSACIAWKTHGGYGYLKDFKFEMLYRDARANTIYV